MIISFLSAKMFPNIIWQLSTTSGKILCDELVLAPGGKVSGYDNPNEGGWEFADDRIYFNGVENPSSVLDRVDVETDPNFTFRGLSLIDGEITLMLKAAKPKVGVFLKTHFWADTVKRAYDNLSNCWQSEIHILCDRTNGAVIPSEYDTVYFDLDEFTGIGLPAFPNKKTAGWYNSDYPNYSLLYKTNYDYFLVIEYDLFVSVDLMNLCSKFIEQGLDYVAPWVSWLDQNTTWVWNDVQKKFDEARKAATGVERHPRDNHKSFFPFCFVSRAATLSCLAGRIDDARLFRRVSSVNWPFCESFFPTHLHTNGFAIETLGKFANISDLVVDVPKSWGEVEKQLPDFAHPVFSGPQLVDKIFAYAPAGANKDGIKTSEWLKRQVARLDTPEELRYFNEKRASFR